MNQKLIAEKLNISQATVSMALKGSPRISRVLSETIRKLAEDSGYHPNLAGQLLRQGRSNVIGVILPSLVNKFYAELFQELQKLLTPRGYLLYFSQIQERGGLEQLADYLKKLRVAGIIAIGSIAGELFPMCSRDTALVFYGGDKPLNLAASQILPDRFQAGLEMTRYLIARGRRRIAFLGVSSQEEQRFRGYCRALNEAGIPFRPELAVPGRDSLNSGYEMMRSVLAGSPDTDGVFAHNDEIAIGAMRAAGEAGYSIPGRLSLAGFDNIETGRYLHPALTTVDQPREAIAELLAEELLASMNDSARHRLVTVPCRLIIREST
ncbi:MAG TPA: hypothetical protein DE060_08755 [Lentisphaeria bacterium]|nr:hypothetical protein [Lentisphaeria bacterium]HCG49277.1 hypothetical protein [Lentisphaeria bacterium]